MSDDGPPTDAYAGVVVIRSWVDALEGVVKGWKAKEGNAAGSKICDAIVQGVNYRSDTTLLCKDFAPRIQTINILKLGESLLHIIILL